jgi:hypothetical protein
MLKSLKQLRSICKWLIFLELLYLIWSLFPVFNGWFDWKVLLSILFYAAVIFLFITVKNRVTFKNIDDASLRLLKPADIFPGNLLVFLIILFGLHYVSTLYMILTKGYGSVIDVIEVLMNVQGDDLAFFKFLLYFIMPLSITVPGTVFFIRLFGIINFSKATVSVNKIQNTQSDTNKPVNHIAIPFNNVLPFIVRADLKDYETGSFIYNPYGNEKLLKKIADDLACTFIVTTDAGDAVIIDKDFITANNISPEELAAKAELNLLKLYQQHCQIVKNEIQFNSILYSIVLNNKNEPSAMFAKNIWSLLSAQHKDHLFVSVPKFNEIHFCTLESNALTDLINHTTTVYNNAGKEALSPNVYLFHNGSWIMFDEGPEQIVDYCVEHKLITLNFNL